MELSKRDNIHDCALATPMVSVIMPAYRVAKYIGAALDSVLAQTFTDYEIIVVNDGSPDTPELNRALAPYRDHIVYIEQENRGCSAARNTAIRVARGRYIALLDPDDIWEPQYLADQVGFLERDPSTDVLYPDATIIGDSPFSGRLFMDVMPSEGEVTFEKLITQRCNVMISVTARRESILRAALFNEDLRGSEDFDMWLRILQQGGRIRYQRKPLVRYRRHSESLSADPVKMCQHILSVLAHAETRNNLSPREFKTLKRQMAHFRALASLNEGKRAFFAGNAKGAISKVREANAFFRSMKLSFALLMLRASPRLLMLAYNLRDRFILGLNTKF